MSSTAVRRTAGQHPTPRPAVVLWWTAVLSAVFVAVPAGPAGWAAVAASVPVALAAVAAAAARTSRARATDAAWLAATRAGLSAAAATALVGVAWTFVVAPGASGLAPMLATVPAMAGLALALGTLAAGVGWAPPRVDVGRLARRGLVAGVGVPLVASVLVLPAQPASAVIEPDKPTTCSAGQQHRSYDVAAATVDVPFNRWGATMKSARIFVLEQDLAATKYWSRPLSATPATDPAQNRRLRPRPLVLRANEGECLEVTLTNRLSSGASHGSPGSARVGIEASGVVTDARGAGGAQVGFNDNPTVGIGQSITYYWRVPAQEGLFLFQDLATPAGGEQDAGSRGIGLYGALAVEPRDSVWTDPRSGAVLSGTPGEPDSTYAAASRQSGELYVEADIHPPGKPSFRESVQIAQDEVGGIGMGFNYGSEPLHSREAKACPDCVGEETWLSSWPYGDPALVKLASGPGPWLPGTAGDRKEREGCGLPESCFVSNVFHAYAGDATKIRFGLAGVKETHVFHLHAHQWLADPRGDEVTGEGPGAKPESSTIDSQSFGPGEAYTADLLYGAGSKNRTFGDSIFHCHLYPHFAEGFWSILRVHDVKLDGRSATPDGVNVRPLVPLPGTNPPAATADNPGYPGMIPGTYGYRAPQPPGSITEGGVDGTPERPAPRLVGGRTIDEAKLAVERAVVQRHNGGGDAPAGAPYSDPCPAGARAVDYDVTVLQRDLVYNKAGHHDPQARFMALTKDVPAILAGTKKVEPLFIRVNAGDCINFSLTNMANNWTGGDAFQQVVQTNMAGGHVHLVKFDVTASDGGSNGWNYQQAAFTKEQMELNRKQAAGEVTCAPGATFYGGESTGCRIADRVSWTPPQDSSGLWGQTIHERWYADYELRTAFTHDHHFAAMVQQHGQYGALIVEPKDFDVRDPDTGEYLQPVNSSAHGTVCRTRCQGGAVGERADLVGPGANDDYREFGIAIADFVPLVKKGGDPRNAHDVVSAPGAPEYYPRADPGTFAVNYRNAPLSERLKRDGEKVDPAHRFSSHVFGDPETPLLEGYARDNVKLRLIQGSQEEQHLFQVHGLRWREEPDDPGSPLVNAQTIGISEAFNAEMPGFDCQGDGTPCTGDYLYGGTDMDDLWNGMWGIMRVHGRTTPGLRPLPDNPATGTAAPLPTPGGRKAPPRATNPGKSCPATAPVRRFDVAAITKDLVYNQYGDHDPEGLMYVLEEDVAAVQNGDKAPEPLVIRANAGDCVQVTLRNALPASYAKNLNGVDGDPPLVLEHFLGTPMGARVSMHPQLVRHDVRLSDGAAIGFNPDSTAGVGQTVSYEWYADQELGATNLLDYGDVRGHRQHGLAGALIIEPKDATYHDPATGARIRSGAAADVRVPGQEDFREMTLVYQDGMDLRTTSGGQVPDKLVPELGPDFEPIEEIEPDGGDYHAGGHMDAGEKGVNYRNAPLHRRLGAAPGAIAKPTSAAWSTVFSSVTHGDPMTPIARAYAGDQLRMRVLGGNRPRQMAFQVSGASWRQEPYDTETELVGVQGGIGTGKAVNAHVRLPSAGDHLWSSPTTYGMPDGVWGIARVYPKPGDSPTFTPRTASQDNPFLAANRPLQPLERTSVTVELFEDTDGDGTRDTGETPAVGTQVRLLTTGGTQLLAGATGADGKVAFSPPRGTYDVRVVPPTGATAVGGATRRVVLTGDAARAELAVGLVRGTGIRAVVFDDLDGDGVRDEGEPGVSGFTVTVDGSAAVDPVVTGDDGAATFADLAAGVWSAGLRPRSGWRATTALPVTTTVGAGLAPVAIGVTQVSGVRVLPVDDTDADGSRDAGEPVLGGLVAEAVTSEGSTTTVRTDDEGAVLDTGRQAARVRLLRPDTGLPWLCDRAVVTTPAGESTLPCDAGGAVEVPGDASDVVVVGVLEDGLVTARLHNDVDRDGVRDPGEAPLADWPVALVRTSDGAEVARTTTDRTGTAGFVAAPGRYDVVPAPPDAAVPWTRSGGPLIVDVVRGANQVVRAGWVQPGSVSVGVFRDNDSDGVHDPEEEPLPDRTVKLLSGTGTLLSTGYTDGTGRVSFPATAGQSYKVNVIVQSGWKATAPLKDTTVLTNVPVRTPADGSQVAVEVGHYNTVDRIAPAAPVATPGSGAVTVLTAPTPVTITGETGAQIRYTLDGTAPSATRGMVYSAPVKVSMDRVLRAVAIDQAGNVSEPLAVAYDLPWKGAQAVLAASRWTVTTGGSPRGGAAETAADDGRYLAVASVKPGTQSTVDVTADVPVPLEMRSAAALNVSVSLRSTMRTTTLKAQYYDVTSKAWRALHTTKVGLDEVKLDVDLGSATRVVAADGTIKVRLVGTLGPPFDLVVDQVTVTTVNRR